MDNFSLKKGAENEESNLLINNIFINSEEYIKSGKRTNKINFKKK